MYTIPTARTLDETLHLIVPEGSAFTARKLFDAMRAISFFPDTDDGSTPAYPASRAADGTLHVMGHCAFWTREDATEVLTTALGDDAPAMVRHFIAAYRDGSVDDLDEVFLFAIAIIVWGGADKGDWITWDLHDRKNTDGKGLGHLCPAYWIARWGKDSLNALVAAGYTYKELWETYQSETLPDPDAIATLVGLRAATA